MISLQGPAHHPEQWCNLTLAQWFWATKVCLQASKICKICFFGRQTGWATSWNANSENYSRYFLMVSNGINGYQNGIRSYQYNTSFHFRHVFLLPAHSSQSRTTLCCSLMSHHRVNNKCNIVRGWHWRYLIYALHSFLLHKNVTCFQKQPPPFLKVSHIPQENTCNGVSFLRSCRPAGLFHVFFSIHNNSC